MWSALQKCYKNRRIRALVFQVFKCWTHREKNPKLFRIGFHTTCCRNVTLTPIHFLAHNGPYDDNGDDDEEEYQYLPVKAPPGASESAVPGTVEWKKTVGTKLSQGDVVCKIVFREGWSLDINAPVGGLLALRSKEEGASVTQGDELFQIKIEGDDVDLGHIKRTTKKKKKTIDRDQVEEEFYGPTDVTHFLPKRDKGTVKSSYIHSSSSKAKWSTQDSPPPRRAQQKMQASSEKDEVETHPHRVTGHKEPTAHRQHHRDRAASLLPQPFQDAVVVDRPKLMTTMNEVNMGPSMEFANNFADTYRILHGSKPGLRSLYLKSAAFALKNHPNLSSKIIDNQIVKKNNVDITISIRHLKVFIYHTLKEVDKMSFIDITRNLKEVEKRIAEGTFKTEKDDRGFTVSAEWELGSVIGTPMHSPTATLGLHSILTRPTFNGTQIVASPMMYVSLTYDSRIADDNEAVNFLKKFKLSVEDARHILV